MPDLLSVVLRSLSFIALFQAAGSAMFLGCFGQALTVSLPRIRRSARAAAVIAALLLLGHYFLEAARMADAMSGMWDGSLQKLELHSAASTVLSLRLLGLAVLAIALGRNSTVGSVFGILASAGLAASFLLVGHTVANPSRYILAPLLTTHAIIVAFWFGALVPLYCVSAQEAASVAADVIHDFSRLAIWLVPGIFVAGIGMALVLISGLADLRRPYGELVIAKIAGFSILMAFAALNKRRFGPAIASGKGGAARLFRYSLIGEYLLISLVLCFTAVMTTFYSPSE